MLAAIAVTAVGFGLLVVASDRFVSGASRLALRLEIPAIVVGAVVIGFGTSLPEMLTSALAAADGAREIALGSVVGSNLANLTLVVGVVALLARPAITSRVLRRELPIMLAAMALLALCLPRLSRATAAVLLGAFAVAMLSTLRAARVADDPLAAVVEHELRDEAIIPSRRLVVELVAGLAGTVAGAQLLVSGARSIADQAGLADGLVGFTLVALGTSLPEVVTGVQSARRGDADLAIGNVLGSNVFNSLVSGGIVGLLSPGTIGAGLPASAWIGVGVGVGVAVMMTTSRQLVRWEGFVLLAAYVATIPVVA